MSRALHIIGIIASLILFVLIIFYVQKVFVERINSFDWNTFDSSIGSANNATREGAFVIGLFFIYYLFLFLWGMLKIKRTTYKVIAIISTVVTLGMLIWDSIMFNSPSHISFDEVAPAFMLYAVFILAFSITGLVQAFRAKKQNLKAQGMSESDLLDS